MRHRRFRRNESFALTSPSFQDATTKRGGIRSRTVLGLVVNPRDKEPLLVVTDGEIVGIRSLQEHTLFFQHGSGYYDTTGHGKSKEAENLTGFPRSHTPQGATPRGAGYGTSLYTALSLGAFLVDSEEADIKMDVRGGGISSESEGRSREADTWWDAALERGLTKRENDENENEEEYVDLDMDADDLEACASLEEGQRITHVNQISVDIVTTSELSIDTFPYYERGSGTSGAYNNDLVPAEFYPAQADTAEYGVTLMRDALFVPSDIRPGSELRWIVQAMMDDVDLLGDANETALLALDVRGLDEQAMNLISLCYIKAGLDDQAVNALWYRWQHELDPDADNAQLGLFSRNARAGALSDVVEARKIVPWDELASLP